MRRIMCLESLWYGRKSQQVTVQPILGMLHALEGINFSYCPCNTEAEMQFYLSGGGAGQPGILYLAFHGNPGSLTLGDTTWLTMQDMAEKMNHHYSGWHVHFASCATLNVDEDKIREFMSTTLVSSVSGYSRYVDWIQGMAMDMLLFSEFQHYRQVGSLQKHLYAEYESLCDKTGFVFVK